MINSKKSEKMVNLTSPLSGALRLCLKACPVFRMFHKNTILYSVCVIPPSRLSPPLPLSAPLYQYRPALPDHAAAARRASACACARHARAEDGHGGSPPEPLLDAVRAHQQQRGLLQRARPEVAQGLGSPHRHRRRRAGGRGITGRQQGGAV